MSLAISNTINDYTYAYKGKLQPKLDKDDNGSWSRAEVENYASSYGKATGTKLDVDAIMAKYADADGTISYAKQKAMTTDDALGLTKLKALADTPSTGTGTGSDTATSPTYTSAYAVNSTLSTYTYSAQNSLKPLLDKDFNGSWNREEVENYAGSYKRATGTTLDVDAIMSKYADDDGTIGAKGQAAAVADDALGLKTLGILKRKVKDDAAAGSTGSGSSGTATPAYTSAFAVGSTVNTYTYSYKGEMSPLLDKDFDGKWSRDEVQNYASSYKKATGSTIDVDAFMKKYADENGYVTAEGQKAVQADDALNLSNLSKLNAQVKADAKTGTSSGSSGTSANSSIGSLNLSDLLASMSGTGKASFANMIQKNESMSVLLEGFAASTSGVRSVFDITSLLNQRSAANLYKVSLQYGNNSSNGYQSMSNQLMSLMA